MRALLLRSRRCWDVRSRVNSTSRIDCRRPFFNCYRCCRLIALFLFRQNFLKRTERYGVREWRKLSIMRFLSFLLSFFSWDSGPIQMASARVLPPPDHRPVEVEISHPPDPPKGRTELHQSVVGFTDAYGNRRGCFSCLFLTCMG